MAKSRALRVAVMRLPTGVERVKDARARRNETHSMMLESSLDLRPRVARSHAERQSWRAIENLLMRSPQLSLKSDS